MPSGTPGFVGARLREAREIRARTAVSLAEQLDLTPAAISTYEHGKNSPTPASLRAMAESLKVPGHFFTRPVPPSRERTIFYRSLTAATKRARTSAEWRLEWLREIVAYVSEFVSIPDSNFPDFGVDDPTLLSADNIEEIA